MKFVTLLLLACLRVYRLILSPILTSVLGPLGLGCRFSPTCSQYAMEALQIHGPGRGLLLSFRRLCRCHPRGGDGYDPVPLRAVPTAETRREDGPIATRANDHASFPSF